MGPSPLAVFTATPSPLVPSMRADGSAHTIQHALERGVGALECAELLTLVAGARAALALSSAALTDLARADPFVLAREHSVETATALRLAAAFELGRRVESAQPQARARLDSADAVRRALASEVRGLSQELFFVLALDAKHALVRRQCVSVGSLNSSLVHPREVFRPAIQVAAAAVICAHNHPSGDPEPSAEDLNVTRRLAEASKLVGIPLLDHVVIGDGRHVSLRQRMSWS